MSRSKRRRRAVRRGLLLSVSLLLWSAPNVVWAQIDPVASTVSAGGPGPVFVSPDGTAPGLGGFASNLKVSVVDVFGNPVTGLGPRDFEVDAFLLPTMADAAFPGGANNIGSLTVGSPGDYDLNGVIYAGGCGSGLIVRVRGVQINNGQPVPVWFNSADLGGAGGNPDGQVNLIDVAAYAIAYGQGYNRCIDFNGDGAITLADVGQFGLYYGTSFPPGATLDVD